MEYDNNLTKDQLSRSRKSIYRLAATKTGHWPFGDHALKKYRHYNNSCISCWQEGNTETGFHFLCECPFSSQIRHKRLETHQAPNLEWLSTRSITNISSFSESIKWFERNDVTKYHDYKVLRQCKMTDLVLIERIKNMYL